MKPYEHYIEAERILEEDLPRIIHTRAEVIALAQVHATLALVKEPKTYPVVYTS